MDTWDRVDRVYRAFAKERHAPGLVAGVVIDGALAHTLTVGVAEDATQVPSTLEHRFRIASMSKSFTALAILELRDRGLLALDTPVAELVPEVSGQRPLTDDARPLSIRDLLHHLAGDVTDDPWGDRLLGMSTDEFSRYLTGGWPAARPAGTGFGYSNLGYALLGRVMTTVAGVRYQDHIRSLLFEPLGMGATTYDFHDIPPGLLAAPHRWNGLGLVPEILEADGEFGAMGGIITTVGDFARYVGFLLDAWPARSGPDNGPIRRSTVRELASGHGHPRLLETGIGIPAAAAVYGYGMIAQSDPDLGMMFQHSGGLPGYGSNVMLFPEMGAGVFSFANVTYAAPIPANRAVAVLLKEAGLIAPRKLPVSPALESAVAAVLAVYDTGNFGPLDGLAAPNLFADQPVKERLPALSALREKYGVRRSHVVEPEHLLAGKLLLTCVEGPVVIDIRLAPTPEVQLQVLTFRGII